MDDILSLLQDFDVSKFLPTPDKFMNSLEGWVRLLVLAGPLVLLCMGLRQGFDRNKILQSMVRAFDKRQVSAGDLDRITTEIEQAIQNSLEREVSTDRIGEMVLERIRPLDEVAYIRFASVYRRFQDVSGFIHEINSFLGEK